MSHVLNLAIQHGLKELVNEWAYLDSEDDEQNKEGLEAISKNHLVSFSIDFENLSLQLIIFLKEFITIRIV